MDAVFIKFKIILHLLHELIQLGLISLEPGLALQVIGSCKRAGCPSGIWVILPPKNVFLN